MAVTQGTFDLANQDRITVDCWSPGVIKRTKFFDILLHYSGYPGMPGPGRSLVQNVRVKAGIFDTTFDATMCAYVVWINPVSREQLRQISSAHEAVFDVGNGRTLKLNESQLAQIRGLLAYTDTLPLFDFPPDEDATNDTKGK